MTTPIRYFAYGSNLLTRRLRGRVPSARPIGRATLADHRLAWHKVGKDGSLSSTTKTPPALRSTGR